MSWVPRLRELEIIDCPKLLSFPPVPWTSGPCSANIKRAGSGFEELSYSRNIWSGLSLTITGKGGQDGLFWNVLAFSNLVDLEVLTINNCPPLPLDHLQKLISLRFLSIDYSSSTNVFLATNNENDVIYELLVECLRIESCGAGEKELTHLLSHFQDLSELEIYDCEKITMVGMVEQQQTTRGEEEIAAGGEGGLFLSSPYLEKLVIDDCPELSLSKAVYPFCIVYWLTELSICGAPKFFADFEPPLMHDSEPASCKLEKVVTDDLTVLVVPICNFLSSSITSLHFRDIPEVQCFTKEQEDALQLLTSLQELHFIKFNSLRCLPAGLQILSSLTSLSIQYCDAFQSLPKDGLPTSLQNLEIRGCCAFKLLPNVSLPSSLRDLNISSCPSLELLPKDSLPSSLQVLKINNCSALKLLPKDGLPCSLQDLRIDNCDALKSLAKEGLPSSLKKLTIWGCPSLKSLPSDGLPKSLQVLDVRVGNSEELIKQCRKLKGTIPIIME